MAVSGSEYSEDEGRFQKLAQMLKKIGSEERRQAYVAIVQAAVVRGRIFLTRAAARELAAFVKDDPKLALQAKLYDAAAKVVTEDYDQAVAQLKSIDRSQLPRSDRSLLDAALNLSGKIYLPPQVPTPVSEPPPVSVEQGKAIKFKQTPRLIDNAKATISQADNILDGDRR